MSETDSQATDTLLPSASISVFSKDSDTMAAATALAEDWRFARVTVNAKEGDVETAIQSFQAEGSTDIVILQTDTIDDSFTDRLGELSTHCDEATAAIIIGPVNDVYLYRQLIEMGVSDYLVRPVKPEILTDVIAKALIARLGVSDSRLIAFVGAKGGLGTSTIAQLGACVAADKMNQKTLLLDAAGGWSPLSVGLEFDPSTTLFEISRAVEGGNEDALERVFFRASEKLTVLASGSDAMLDPSVSAAQYEAILDNLMVKFPVVLADLSSSETSLKKAVLGRANQIVMVTDPTVTSLRFCRSLIKEISTVRGGKTEDISLLVNRVGICKANEVSEGDIKSALEFAPAGSIPYNPSLFLRYESAVKGLLEDKDSTALAPLLSKVLNRSIAAAGLVEDDGGDDGGGIFGGFLSKMKSK